jgi:hypothetical protein
MKRKYEVSLEIETEDLTVDDLEKVHRWHDAVNEYWECDPGTTEVVQVQAKLIQMPKEKS